VRPAPRDVLARRIRCARHARRLLVGVILGWPLVRAAAQGGVAPSGGSAAVSAVVPTAFGIGEALRYEVRVAPFGRVGEATMWVEGPVEMQGVRTWRLRFDLAAGVGPIRGVDRTSSWIDPTAFAVLRYEKHEANPVATHEERVMVDRVHGRWRDEVRDAGGPLADPHPLDELSFIYLLRTLPLEGDSVRTLTRHFDIARNPVRLHLLGREIVATPAGIFRTRVVEMEVRDPRRPHGVGRIRINLDDDPCRMPVRIESRMPRLGVTTLLLTGWAHPPNYPGTVTC
jgi:hypothetical protein